MVGNKIIYQVIISTVLCVFSIANGYAQGIGEPNGKYSSIGVAFISNTPENPLCIGTDCHKELMGAEFGLSYQVIPNLVIGLSSASAQSNHSNSNISATSGELYLGLVVGIGAVVDVGAKFGSFSSTTKVCTMSPSTCSSGDDTGSDLGLFGRVWIDPQKTVDIGLSYNKSSTKYSTWAIGITKLILEHHELNASTYKTVDSNGFNASSGYSLGYSYLF